MNRIHALVLAVLFATMGAKASSAYRLWYRQPASHWLEALPVGNGRLGAMVYGGTRSEEIQLSEETFWSGGPYNNNSPESLSHLDEVRQLIFSGREDDAEPVINKYFFPGPHGMRLLPVASVKLDMECGADTTVSLYERQLDLQRAVATTTFCLGGVNFERTVFTSLADDVMVVHLKADKKKAVNLSVSQTHLFPSVTTVSDGELVSVVDGQDHEGVRAALKAECRVKVVCDGTLSAHGDRLRVEDATQVTLLVSAATNFVNYHDVSGDAAQRNTRMLEAAAQLPFRRLLGRHVEAYRRQFDRVSLTLPESEASALPTDERLGRFAAGGDMALVALMFNYGRYLLLSSSQPGGQPSTLQGIWNDRVNAPWDSKYTININTEMNYWLADAARLDESKQPLFSMLADLSRTGAETARTMYGCRGWMAHHNTDLWRIAGPVDGATWGMFPNGGAWLATHLWQHYLFTADEQFLRQWYPVIKGTADFYLDYMQLHPTLGWLVTVPSVSPEHGPMGKKTTVTAGCTMDNQIAFDALSNTLAAATLLGERQSYTDSLRAAIALLPPMQIGRHGQLQEWLQDADDPTDEHRHISHLYGLYPSNQITPHAHPDLFAAARNTLLQRGDMATGWSLGWKINFWARMLDGNHAFQIISNMLHLLPSDSQQKQYPDGRTYPNLFDAHPPFQIDGNFGCAAGVAEMLVQSHDGAVHLLPALPDAWSEGEVRGLRTRGAFLVDIEWSAASLTRATVTSTVGGTLRLRSYVPLRGEGLREAVGECPNAFLRPAEVKDAVVSAALDAAPAVTLRRVFDYDLDTQAGHAYTFTAAE